MLVARSTPVPYLIYRKSSRIAKRLQPAVEMRQHAAAVAEQPLDGLMTSIALQMPAGDEEATQASSFQPGPFPSFPALPPLLVYYHLIAP